MVWYGGTPPPNNTDWKNPGLEAAQSVMSQIEGPASMGYNPSEVTPGALVTVQTGNSLTLKPIVSKKAAKGKKSTTTTVFDPSGIKSNPNLGTPSPTNPVLEPWDPRACNAAGTGPATTP